MGLPTSLQKISHPDWDDSDGRKSPAFAGLFLFYVV